MQASKQLYDDLLQQITVYESQEAKEIVFWLMEFYFGLKKIDILSNKSIENKEIDWKSITERLNNHEPIQYILGETEFFGRRFLVNKNVLIPRPETEELVKFIIEYKKALPIGAAAVAEGWEGVLDLGTGSGCIAISLAKELPNCQVFAWDISEKALKIAQKNAELNNANVIFEKVDILNGRRSASQFLTGGAPLLNSQAERRPFSIIVSNPPYVKKQEIDLMQKNVLDFEPHLALFVEDNNPLIFYDAIAKIAHNNLTINGLVIVEINETLGKETAEIFIIKGFSEVEIIKDIHQKERFIKAILRKKD